MNACYVPDTVNKLCRHKVESSTASDFEASHCHQRCGYIWFTSIDMDRPEALVILTFFTMTVLFIIQIWPGMYRNQPISVSLSFDFGIFSL